MATSILQRVKRIALFRDLILIWLIVTIIYASTVVLDIQFFPEAETTIPIPLEAWLGAPTDTPDITMALFVRCNGTLVVEKPVTLSGFAYLNTTEALNFNITNIALGVKLLREFPPANTSSDIPKGTNLQLTRVNGTNILRGDTVVGYWANSGDYVPTFTIYANNYKYPSDFPLSNVHVEPLSALQSEKFNRISIGLAYVATSLALIEGALLARRIWKGDVEKTES